jgi:CO dehydrogenase maturation factor
MKISVCGKGGSGKSVMVTLMANAVRRSGYRALVVDADESNSTLYRLLGFDEPPKPLLELAGGKKMVKQALGPKDPKAGPGAETSVLSEEQISVSDLPAGFAIEKDGIGLISVGKILQALEGCACPMGVLSREFLKKLRLRDDEIAIVDTEAGVEHFGRGMETSIDAVVIVVEPSFESLQLAERVNALADGIGIESIWAVLNKVSSDEIAAKMKEELERRGLEVAGVVYNDPQVFEACLEGRPLDDTRAAEEVRELIDSLISRMQI